MIAWSVALALITWAAGCVASGRIVFLLNNRTHVFKTIDFVILGSIALIAFILAFVVPFLIFYDLAADAPG